jgi:urease accessory protein
MAVFSRRTIPDGAQPSVRLALTFEERRRSRFSARANGGETVWVMVERGRVLRDGERLLDEDARVLEIAAAPEPLLHIAAGDPLTLARAAYHLGNRHAHVQVGDGWLRCEPDRVLADMCRGLGLAVSEVDAPFEPEPGAYAAGHHAHADGTRHGGIIHDHFAGRARGR